MKNKKFLWLVIILVIVAIFGWFFGFKENESFQVTIGVILPLSGESAAFGEKFKDGIEVARKDFSTNELVVVYEDSQGIEAKGAISAYHKLVSADKIDLVLGPFGPEQTLALAPLAEKSGIPVFAFSLCDPRFATYSVVFCSFPSTEDTIKTGVSKINELGLKNIYAVTHQIEPGLVFEEILRSLQTENGFKLVEVDKISTTDYDYRTAIAKIIRSEADAIYIYSFPEPGHVFLDQLSKFDFSGEVFASLDTTEERLQNMGGAADGVYFPGFLPTDYLNSFLDNYKQAYNVDPDLYGALGHSVAQVIFEVLEKSEWDKSKLVAGVAGYHTNKTAIGNFYFKNDRTVSIPQKVFIFENNRFREI